MAPGGGKWWRPKYRHDGKEKHFSLGTYPDVNLTAARARRESAHQKLAEGKDPSALRKAAKATEAELVRAIGYGKVPEAGEEQDRHRVGQAGDHVPARTEQGGDRRWQHRGVQAVLGC